ncbi:hypothetical protein NG798_26465 [Ancylothrix sp. C2]|uniref:hypothetical protein n=1 Tax=Ancylothrix sp. D3o TaxID=2953691 RepID=UPI0021BAC6A3|nr:hypothetical protein [Ancylothrix sp. D3o]MCT7953347.1 hypothetical protein [Ancylothrix sp. D3o]
MEVIALGNIEAPLAAGGPVDVMRPTDWRGAGAYNSRATESSDTDKSAGWRVDMEVPVELAWGPVVRSENASSYGISHSGCGKI